MKKYVLSMLAIICFMLPSIAQSGSGYHPILKEGKVWNYTLHSETGDVPLYLKVEGDTVVDGHTCRKLYLHYAGKRKLYGCYYEQGGEVYGYVTIGLRYVDGQLNFYEKETVHRQFLFLFLPSPTSQSASFADYNVRPYARALAGLYPDMISGSLYFDYELIRKEEQLFARSRFMLEKTGHTDICVSGVGNATWGIMEQQKPELAAVLSFESCYEYEKELFTKADFNRPALLGDYRPFVEEGKVWTFCGNRYGNQAYTYSLRGDTIVGGVQCVKMYSENLYNDGEVRYEGAYYEFDRQVYCFQPGNVTAVLMYDFSSEPGQKSAVFNTVLGQAEIAGHVYEMCGGVIRHIYVVVGWEDYDSANYGAWVEGVGPGWKLDVTQPIGFGLVGDGYGGIVDCSVNGKSLYRTSRYEDYANSVVSHTVSPDSCTSAYDLQGRRLTVPPVKGLYIQNGRKVIVK